MKKFLRTMASGVAIGAAMSLLVSGVAVAQDDSQSSPRSGGANYHIFPTVAAKNAAPPASDPGPLLYHGGPVMQNGVTAYIIYWAPATLQTGGATSISAHYQAVEHNMLSDYIGHGIYNNSTQYYQVVSGATTYIQNRGTGAIVYNDSDAYPGSGCSDSVTPGNCITDAQLQTELQHVMTVKGWTGGLNKVFMVFTSSGEGSCFDSTSSTCAYTQYCAYHGYFLSGSTPVIYANMPFADPSVCQEPGAPSPNGDVDADEVASTASHEFTESITDPELNAWFTAKGNEIGDLCAYLYGTPTWDSSKANESWNGHNYLLQMEYDNHVTGCVQVGP